VHNQTQYLTETDGAVKEKLHNVATLALSVRGPLHAPSTLPTLKQLDTYWTGGWVPQRANIDAAGQIKKIFPYRGSIYVSHDPDVHTRRRDQSCRA
jgi:hypothetical protein